MKSVFFASKTPNILIETFSSKQMHSWFMRPNILPWAMTSDNAPFDLKIGEELGLELLSTFQGGGCDYVA